MNNDEVYNFNCSEFHNIIILCNILINFCIVFIRWFFWVFFFLKYKVKRFYNMITNIYVWIARCIFAINLYCFSLHYVMGLFIFMFPPFKTILNRVFNFIFRSEIYFWKCWFINIVHAQSIVYYSKFWWAE